MGKRITIDALKEIAIRKGGTCLSDKYLGIKVKHRWRCKLAHEWLATPDAIKNKGKNGSWCPECNVIRRANAHRLTIDSLHEIATSKNGRCLSTEYTTSKEKYQWECSKGHIWWASADNVRRASWCPTCAGKTKQDSELWLGKLKAHARSLNGRFLSNDYTILGREYKWECEDGHQWMCSASKVIKNNLWCPFCNDNKEDIKKIGEYNLKVKAKNLKLRDAAIERESRSKEKEFNAQILRDKKKKDAVRKKEIAMKQLVSYAKSKGGRCLSKEYDLRCTKYEFECSIGHKWTISASSIINMKTWCPYCSGKKATVTIDDIREYAESRDGYCLSSKFIGNDGRYKWKCKEGHEWEDTYRRIKGLGTWCPYCDGRRHTIKRLTDHAKFMGGRCLSDKYTRMISKYQWECSKGHQWTASAHQVITSHTWCPYCAGRYKSIDELHKHAKKRGGRCLSDVYTRSKDKYKWECKKGHRWEANYDNVRGLDNWCPYCAKVRLLSIDDLIETAKSKGGELLSKTYGRIWDKYKWKCSKGHIWLAHGAHVRHGKWCPECARLNSGSSQLLTIEDLQETARKKNGLLLSTVYVNSKTKYEWQCDKGHVWLATANCMRHTGWCPICSQGKSERFTIKVIESIFSEKFEKIRPGWLLYKNGKPLEFDGFNYDLKIAVEYNGIQHYELKDFFHRDESVLRRQMERDAWKEYECEKRGIVFVKVPYFKEVHNTNKDKIQHVVSSVRDAFARLSIPLPNDLDKLDIHKIDVIY